MKTRGLVYLYAIWIALFTVIPLSLIVYYSLHITVDGQTVLSLENFMRIFETATIKNSQGAEQNIYIYIDVIGHSVKLAAICTFFCFALGYPAGYILAEKRFETRNTIVFLFMVPMWMNILLRSYAWLTILEKNGILNSILGFLGLPKHALLYTDAAVTLGMVYSFIPFMILPIYTILKKMDNSLIEAAQDLGANGRQVFSKVIFPLSMPGVISGVTMVLIPAITTFAISRLLGGAQYMLYGDLIENQFIAMRSWNTGSALSMVMLVLVLISMWVSNKYDKTAEGGAMI